MGGARGRFVPDTEVVKHQLAQQELEGAAALSYEEYLRKLTQAVDTEVRGPCLRRCIIPLFPPRDPPFCRLCLRGGVAVSDLGESPRASGWMRNPVGARGLGQVV